MKQFESWLRSYRPEELFDENGRPIPQLKALAHIIDSMFNQHAKWLASCRELPWRAPVSSLSLLLTSTIWRRTTTALRTRNPGSSIRS
jgi:xylulose-5-phosphate/fructose-6-phosphate phosphoketolase